MPIITMINPKGGVGKTTLSLNLGLLLAAQSSDVIFIDLDPQRSLSDWLNRRPQFLSQFKCIKSSCEKIKLDEYMSDNESIYIIDPPAGLTMDCTSKLLKYSDVILIPTNPTPVDLNALSHFLFKLGACDEFQLGNESIALIANKAKSYTRLHSDVLNKIEKFGIPLIATFRDTQNYTLPATKGMGIADLPTYHTKSDLQNWQPVLDLVNRFCANH